MKQMRKNNFLKKCIAMLLVVSLMGSQLLMPSNISFAADASQDVVIQETETTDITETTGTDSENNTSNTGSADTTGDTDSADSSILSIESIEEVTNTSSSDESELSTGQTEVNTGSANESESETETEASAMSVTASLSADAASNTENEYQVSAAFTVSGSGEETVRLALCMDEITYAILLDSCATEPETATTDTCVITLSDHTLLTTAKTVLDDGSIRLNFDYLSDADRAARTAVTSAANPADDTMTVEFVLAAVAGAVEENVLGTLSAAWCTDPEEEEEDEAWSVLDKIRIRWNAVEGESETETETESESETETEIETEDESESETEIETETESEVETEIETETESEVETETEAETELESEIETETESETESETEAEIDTEAETETESFHTSVSARLLASEPALVSEEESDTETATESESETQETTISAVNLTDYLTATSAVVDTETNLISVSLSYSINTSVLQEAGTNIVEYQIPDNISAKKAYSGSVMDGDTVVGTYTISVDGLIQIVFDEDYISGTPADIKGTISFWAKTSEEQVGEDNTMEIVFSDDYSIEVEIDKSLFTDYDVTVDKSCTDTVIDKENGVVTFTYSIEVTTDNGTGTTFDFEDVLSGTHYDLAEYSDLMVTKYSSNGSEVTGFGNTLSIVEGTSTSNPYVSGTLASLEAGEKYVITYTVTRTLDDDDDSITMSNAAKASNTYTTDIDYSYNTASLYDMSVTKTSPDSPVLDRDKGTITNTYTVTVSSTMGTKGEIDLTDTVSFWPTELDYTTSFKVSSITKYTTDDSGEVTETKLDLSALDMDSDGQLVGTLPELEAGEYYVIEYTLTLSDLPEDELVTFSLINKVNVSDDFSSKYTYDNDYISWVGKAYVNWISKTGTYDSSTGTITWTIVLNEGGYGNLNGLTLTDVLKHNGVEVNDIEDITFDMTEQVGYVSYPFYASNNSDFKLSSFKFVDGTTYTAWDDYSWTIDTTDQFTITYTTTVDDSDVTTFFNTYTNTATIDGHSDTAEVTVPLNTVDKEFTGSAEYTGSDYTGGYVLFWMTSIDVPQGGLAAGSTFTDTVSDSSSKQANSKNWFTKSMLKAMTLTIGSNAVTASYDVTCTGTDASGNAFSDKALDDLADTDKISSFKITFTDGIGYADGEPLVISYTSYSASTDLAYNTGTYTEGENSVSDEAAGKGDDGTLVSKYNADGTTTLKTELASLQDTYLGGNPYLLTYKIVVNENNSADGTITITDTLPEGTTLYQKYWKYSIDWQGNLSYTDTSVFEDGVYFYYQPYDTKNYVYPYSNTSETTGRNAYLSSGSYVYGGTALSYIDGGGVTVTYDGTTRKLTITIPEDVYKTTIESTGEEANYTMVLYYAVEITDTNFSGTYEQSFSNSVTVTDGDGNEDTGSVTDTVVASNVSKTGTYNNDTNVVDYEVEINPLAVTLIEGQQSTLTVKDTFSNAFNTTKWAYYVTDIDLVPGSLVLYKNVNGTWVECNEDIISSTLSVYNYQAYLTVEVPDGAYYKLTYSYLLTFADFAEDVLKDDGTFSVENSVKVEGLGSLGNSDSTTSEIEESGSSSSATKNYAKITLYKRDSANATLMLEGAEFTLERFDGVSWETVYNGDSDTFVTDSSGAVALGDKLSDGTSLIAFNYLYRLREIKAPDGYQIHADYMYFYVQGTDGGTIVAPDGWETDYADHMLTVVNNSYILVEDEQKDEGKTEFVIHKEWQDADGNTIETPTDESGSEITSITVDLYKTVGGTTTKYKEGIELTSANGWITLISDLPIYENSELIYYYVVETNVPEGWAVSYTNNGNPTAADTDDEQIVVTNISSDGTIPVSVSKKWLMSDGVTEYTTAPEESVEVTLRRKYEIPASTAKNAQNGTEDTVTVTVNVEDKNNSTDLGTTIYTSTLTGVTKNSLVTLYIESPGFNHLEGLTTFTNDSGESVAVSPSYTWSTRYKSSDDTWLSCETLTFYATDDVTVTIGNQWCEYAFVDTSDSQYNFSVTNDPNTTLSTGTTVTDDTFSETVTLSGANKWTYSWAALPQYSSYDTEYTYWIEEIAPSGYYISSGLVPNTNNEVSMTEETEESSGTVVSLSCVVTNQRYPGIDTTVTVKKKWKYDDGTSIADDDPAASLLSSVTLELYRSTTTPAELESEQAAGSTLSVPSSSELVDTVTISAAEDWTYTWEYLDKYYENNSAGNQYYYYYVVEADTGELYTVNYTGNGVNETAETESEAGVQGTTADPIVVTNTVATAEVTVTKTWVDRNSDVMESEGFPDSVEVQLYRKADSEGEEDLAYGTPVLLGTAKSAASNSGTAPDGYSDDGWSYTWSNLLQGEYYVTETSVDGFSTTYYVVQNGDNIGTNATAGLGSAKTEADEALTSTSGGTVIVYNQEIPVELTVTKEWGDGVTPEEVTIQLYRSTTRPSKSIKTVTVYKETSSGTQTLLTAKQISGDTVTLAASIYYTSLTSAPTLTCTSDGEAIVSEAIVTEASNVKTYTFTVSNLATDCVLVLHTNDTWSEDSIAITGSNMAPTSTELAEDTGLLSVDLGEEVTTNATDYPSVTLTSDGAKDSNGTALNSDAWTYTWTNLPHTDADGNIYYYYVKESSTSNSYVSSYSYTFNEDGSIKGVTVLNSKSLMTSVTVQKKWVDVTGEEKDLTEWSIELTLYKKNAEGEWEVYTLDPTKTISGAVGKTSTATASWENLPAGEYYVEETSKTISVYVDGTLQEADTSSYTVTYSTVEYTSQSESDDSSDPEEASTMGGETEKGKADIYITNTEGSTGISVVKRWSDGSANHTSDSVTMNLYSSTTDPATAESESQAKQGKTVVVYYDPDSANKSHYDPYLAKSVICGNTADIRIYYDSYRSIDTTQMYIKNSTGTLQYAPTEIKSDSNGQYLLFSDVQISCGTGETESFYFYYTTSSYDDAAWPKTPTSYNSVTEAEDSDASFDTLINPVDSSQMQEIASETLSSSNKWTATWSNLPLTDENGNTLYYYVEEASVQNCATTYAYTYNTDGSISKVTVTNRPTSGDTNVTVEKKWTDVNGTTLATTNISDSWSITVQLYAKSSTGTWEAYKDADNKIVTLELSNTNSWTGVFKNLPNGDYCVKEISMQDSATSPTLVSENYTVYYQVGSQTATEDAESASVDDTATITITNAETPTSIEVTKVWQDESGNILSESEIPDGLSVEMTLYSSTVKPDVVESGSVEYQITLKGAYTGETPYNLYNLLKDPYHMVVNSSSIRVYIKTYNTSSAGCYITCTDNSAVCSKITDDDTVDIYNYISYVVFEVSNISSDCEIDFYGDFYPSVNSGENIYNIIEEVAVEATNPVGEYVTVTSPLPDGVTTSTATQVGTTQTLSKTNGWSYSWDALPTHDSDGKQLYYYVVEGDCSGYTTTYEQYYREDGSVEKVKVTNTASGSETTIDVSVNKKWVYSDDMTTEVTDSALLPESVTFALYYSTVSPDILKSAGKTFPDDADLTAYVPGGNTAAETEVVTADSNGDWSYTWKDLPKYATDGTTLIYYYVKETCIDGTEITTTPVYENNGSAGDTGSNAITVTNTVDTASVTVKKTWTDAGGTAMDSSVTSTYSVTLQLYQWDEDGGTAGGGDWVAYGGAITLSADSATDSTGVTIERNSTEDWTYIWTHLPAGKYYVEETGTTAKGGFTVSYHGSDMAETDPDETEASKAAVEVTTTDTGITGSNSGTITVTNQKESTEISVEKIWKDSTGETDPDQSETVTMYLYRTTTPLTEAQTEALQIIADATDNEYTKGTSSGATIKCSGELSEFESVAVDGTTVGTENYTEAEGSTIITFTQAYLDTLSTGDHTVTLYYTGDRSISATLTIKEAVVTTETEDFAVSIDWGSNTVPTTGSVTASIYSCDSDGTNTSSEAVAMLVLKNESDWSGTVALPSATLTDDEVTAYYYYKVVIGATSIETDSGTYTVAASEIIISTASEVTAGTTATVSGTFTEKQTETQTQATEAATVSLTVAIDTWVDTEGYTTTSQGGWIWVQVLDSNGTDAGNATLSSDNNFTTTFSGLENGVTYIFKYSCSSDIFSKQWQNIKTAKVSGSSSTAAESGEESITLDGNTTVGLTATYYQPETTTLTFTVDTTSWDEDTDTANGKITVSIYPEGSETCKYEGTLNAANGWSLTSDELYWGSDASYKIKYGCDGSVITVVSGTETLTGGGDTKITLSATLADSSSESGPWTVTVYDSDSSYYPNALVSSQEVSVSTITVLLRFTYDPATWCDIYLECTSGNASSKYIGYKTYNQLYYEVFEVTGIDSNCELTLYPLASTGVYPEDSGSLIICDSVSNITWDDETASIQSYEETLTASLTTNSHTFTTSGENGSAGTTTESESESEVNGLYASNETEKYDEVTLGGTEGLSYTWNNLDKYDADGNLYYYYIVEKSVDGYTSSYLTDVTITTTSKDGQVTGTTTTIDKVTVTNTKDTTPISVTVKKDWSGYNTTGTPNEYDDYTVEVTLVRVDENQSESDVETIELGTSYVSKTNYDDGGWSYTWSNLDASYSYYVKEGAVTGSGNASVENYTTAYQTKVTATEESGTSTSTSSDAALSATGTITITNTRTSGQGITMPGTGSKYPLVFYGLGLSFLVASTTWMLYAFKKKKKYKYAGKGGAKPDSS